MWYIRGQIKVVITAIGEGFIPCASNQTYAIRIPICDWQYGKLIVLGFVLVLCVTSKSTGNVMEISAHIINFNTNVFQTKLHSATMLAAYDFINVVAVTASKARKLNIFSNILPLGIVSL